MSLFTQIYLFPGIFFSLRAVKICFMTIHILWEGENFKINDFNWMKRNITATKRQQWLLNTNLLIFQLTVFHISHWMCPPPNTPLYAILLYGSQLNCTQTAATIQQDMEAPRDCSWVYTILVDWVNVLHPTQPKTGHFGDVPPSQSLGLVWKKLNLTQQKHAFTNHKRCTTTQNKHKN